MMTLTNDPISSATLAVQATARFRQYAAVPSRWINLPAVPLWDSVLIVNNPLDVDLITALMTPLLSEDCPDDHLMQRLSEAGWFEVGDTGVLTTEYDGELLLGLNVYSESRILEQYFIPLYVAMTEIAKCETR